MEPKPEPIKIDMLIRFAVYKSETPEWFAKVENIKSALDGLKQTLEAGKEPINVECKRCGRPGEYGYYLPEASNEEEPICHYCVIDYWFEAFR